MDSVVAKYNQENSEKQLIEIYQGFIDTRITLFQKALEPIEQK